MSEISRLWNKHKGTLRAALTATAEERRIMRTFPISELVGISNFRYLSGLIGAGMVCSWARERGIVRGLEDLGLFSEEDFLEYLAGRGYKLSNTARRKAAYSLLRILAESGHLSEQVSGTTMKYRLENVAKDGLPRITRGEQAYAEANFAGLFSFYAHCLDCMEDFLRQENPSFDYSADFAHLWRGFLGNPSQLFIKRYLYRALDLPDKGKGLLAFVIAYGQGYDIFELLAAYPELRVVTIDYVDDHVEAIKEELRRRFGSDSQVEFIPSSSWSRDGAKGFGVELPLPDNSVDVVIGNSFDAAIPEGKREFVWKDMTRTLKPGGKTGATVAMLPRADTVHAQDKWQRLYLFSHNFIETVTADFVGFPYLDETASLFQDLGYTAEGFRSPSLHLFNGFVWRMTLGSG